MLRAKRSATGLAIWTSVCVGVLLVAAVIANGSQAKVMYAFIEDARASAGVRPVRPHAALIAIAERHAERMSRHERIWHNPHRVVEMHATGLDWNRVGENVAAGFDIRRINRALMDSPSHRRNILDGRFNAVGIGVVEADERLYITQIFAWLPAKEPAKAPAPARALRPEPVLAEDCSVVPRSFYTSMRAPEPSAPSISRTRASCVASSSTTADPSSETVASSGTHDLHPAK
jgi:hypothetical protein